ncbi:MAG: TlpA family protein disulfide reductase [Ilumatobacteraceae bacterium]
MGRNRKKVVVAVLSIVLLVSVVGGWALSRSSDDVDANLTDPGVEQTPGIGTNANNTGKKFSFVPVTDVLSGVAVTITPTGKPMVVNFWFSTCEPCKREMPVLTAAAETYGAAVNFVGINPNDTTESASAFLTKYGIKYANYLDDGDQLAAAGVTTMPTTVFINADGYVVKTRAGELTTEDIDNILQNSLGVTK